MTPQTQPSSAAENAEILALIETLHDTEHRLETLTAGQVDTVAARDGRTMLLRRSQDDLRLSDAARQVAIMNSLPAHVALLDAHGVIVSVNETWHQFPCSDAGHGPGLEIGSNYLRSCDVAQGDGAADSHRAAEGVRSVLEGENDRFSMQYHCRLETAAVRWFLLTATPLKEVRPGGAVLMHVDVTRQRVAEQELRASESRFRQMAENVDEVFFLRAPDGRRAFYISPAYERIWGRTCESFYENPDSWMDAVHPYDRASIAEKNRAGLLAGKFEYEYRIVRPDGSVRWIASRGFPVRDDAGIIVRIAGIAQDISQRMQALEKLRESEARYRALTEASFDAINVTQGGIIREVNAGFERMFGYEASEVIGQPMAEFCAPESADVVRRWTCGNVDGNYDLVGVRRNGERILLEVTVKANEIAGKPACLAALRDVTDRRRLEDQFRQAQKLEAVGRLAAGVAHDFNNLLTVITSYASFVYDDLGQHDPRRADIQEIQKAAEGAAGLTRQLLLFSRQQVTAPRIVSLEVIVTGLEKMLRRLIGEDIDLITMHGSESSTTLIDPGHAEQVIMNLVINARDAMPTGGKVTIETAVLDLDDDYAAAHWPATAGRFVMLAVSDTGIGMDSATRARVFEPFFTTKGSGTGLGLATVYGIVKQSGGSIWVYSEPGEGACFKIFFPLVAAPAAAAEPDGEHHATHAAIGSETILLAEDSPSVRGAVRQTLERLGYRVREARSGADALELAAGPEPIDLLLTDVVMPEMSGRILAERFGVLRPNAEILYMSGYTDDAVLRHGVSSSAVEYIEKPFTAERLDRKLRDIFDRRPAINES